MVQMSLISTSPKYRARRFTMGREGRGHANTKVTKPPTMWTPPPPPPCPSPERQRPRWRGSQSGVFCEAKLFKHQQDAYRFVMCSVSPQMQGAEAGGRLQTDHAHPPAEPRLLCHTLYTNIKNRLRTASHGWQPLSADRSHGVNHRNIVMSTGHTAYLCLFEVLN